MNFSKLIEMKKDRIKKCDNQIDALKKGHQNEVYQEDKDKLLELLEQKIELLNSLNAQEDPKEFTKKLETINEKIHRQYLVFKQNIKDNEDNQDFINHLDKAFSDFEVDRLKKSYYYFFKKILLFCIRHPLIIIFILYLAGGYFFMFYFYGYLRYIPNISKENFLYYSLLIAFSIPATGSLFIIFCAMIPLTFKLNFPEKNNFFSLLTFFRFLYLIIPFIPFIYKGELFKFKYPYIFIFFIFFCIIVWLLIYTFFSSYLKTANYTKTNISFWEKIKLNIISMLALFSPLFVVLILLKFQENETLINILISGLLILLGLIAKDKIRLMWLFVLAISLISFILFISESIKLVGLGNYTPEALVVDSKAYIPQGLLDMEEDSKNLIIKNPKILSNVGEDYLVELKDKNGKLHRFTIPKNLVKSQLVPNQDKKD